MITSPANLRIKHVCQLIKSASLRRQEGVFVIEGMRICAEAPRDRIVEAYISEGCMSKIISEGISVSSNDFVLCGAEYEVVSDAVFKKMSDTVSGQGVLCVVKQDKRDPFEFIKEYADLAKPLKLLILENIQDPGNLGTMIRTSEAAGFDGIITDDKTVDVFNPKVIRSTMGGIFRMPVMVAGDFAQLLNKLKESKVTLYAALLEGSSDFHEVDFKDRLGILIGNEGNGLTKDTAQKSDIHVRIPMEGQVESLNAAVAAALLMYEASR